MRTTMICGLRKSGTSMVRSLLDGHSKLSVCPMNELHIFSRLCAWPIIMPKNYHLNGKNADELNDAQSYRDVCGSIADDNFLTRLADPQANDYIDEDGSYVAAVSERLRKAHPASLNDLLKALYQSFFDAEPSADSHFLFKQVLSEEVALSFLKSIDESKVIYVLRNPYAHLVSARKAMQASKYRKQASVGRTVSVFEEHLKKIPFPSLFREIYRMSVSYKLMSALAEQYPDDFRIVVYDKLVASPDSTMSNLCDFLGIEMEDIMLRTTVKGQDITRHGRTGGAHSSKISTSAIDGWKSRCTKLEVDLVNRFFIPVLDRFGFEHVDGRDIGTAKIPHSGQAAAENKMLMHGFSNLIV